MSLAAIPGLRTLTEARFRRTVLAVVLAGAAVHFLLVLLSSLGNMPDLREVFIPSARRAYAGLTLYHRLPVGAPGHFTVGTSGPVDTPPFLLLMWPWTVLGDGAGQVAWEVLQLAALAAALVLTYAGIGRPGAAELMVTLVLLMFAGPIRDSFLDGQVSIVLGALMAAAILGHRSGRPVVGGLALGVAGAIKLTPLLALPYFLWKRDYRLSAWAMGTSAGLFAASVLSGHARGITQFPAVISQLSSGTAAAQNQSVGGLVLRLLLPDRTAFPIVPPPLGIRVVVIVAQVALLVLMVWLVARVAAPAGLRAWLEFSIVLLVIPALQPFAWPHHWAWAVLAVPVWVRAASRGVLDHRVTAAMFTVFVLLTLLEFPLYSAAQATATHPVANPLLALGASVPLLAMIALALLVGLGARAVPAPRAVTAARGR